MATNKDSDYFGVKSLSDLEVGHTGGGFLSLKSVAPGIQVATNTIRKYIGGVECFSFQTAKESGEAPTTCIWRWTVISIVGDTLTFQFDVSVSTDAEPLDVAPVSVDRSESNESQFLEPADITLESDAVGRGATVRQLYFT